MKGIFTQVLTHHQSLFPGKDGDGIHNPTMQQHFAKIEP